MTGLADSLAEAFRLLARGVADRRHPFHTPTLATIAADGAPSARTVVLRGFAAEDRLLRIHSDVRAAKVAELTADPRASLHFYDQGAAVQLRLSGSVTLHRGDAVAEAAWQQSRPLSRLCYAIDPAPGSACPAPPPMPEDVEAGRPHFCVLRFRLATLEWLHLARQGHRRARFAWGEGQAMEATWLVP
ncbi:pyridoxamine 5'-phosphate oxidase family protein [Falsiroseomonas selenitidurans]|uniref:Pyridoxamine 5'-phosphate oxidase n=1 Tax=Falsiroseomonas selenitidurans TaxID=2716335 RepID=A0ABX1E0J9_9PROT|nr:pyridoxamine 5'-phosphate oxidase family protein [Falsiroseomonas selenitidurans]NKC30298.1 pyridoxamine 5'-phosphate oxidase [Falsiroseomonas selenitidurans]